ncbi:MAG TPA: trehalose-phosphatase [Actinomycetota bacterium]
MREPNERDLREIAARATELGLFLDFDGTLAPIVDDPASAAPLAGVPEALRAIGPSLALAMVVSGRPVAFLRRAFGELPGVELAGLYGLERVRDGVEESRAGPETREAVAEARASLERLLPALHVEDKGAAVTVHSRRAPDPVGMLADAEAVVREVAAEHGLLVRPGRLALELVPDLAIDKGAVVAEAIEQGTRAAVVAGDDRGDVPAFRAAEAAGWSLRIAVVSDEAPPELLAEADRTVQGPEGLLGFLRRLASSVRP